MAYGTPTGTLQRDSERKWWVWTGFFPRRVTFAHNHPSGVAEPSQADQMLTETLQRALALVDVKVLDHFVVGRGAAMSFAERGLL